MVERGVVRNVTAGSMVSHGENLTLECINLYEPAHGLATFTCNNGTWNVIPRCEPGTAHAKPWRRDILETNQLLIYGLVHISQKHGRL